MVENLEKLTKERAQIKSKLTRFKNYINSDQNQSKLDEIEARLEAVNNLLDQFESVESQIESLSAAGYETQLLNFENEFYEAIGKAKSLISNASSNNSIRNSASSSQSNRFLGHGNAKIDVKLPTIELPNFNGEQSHWISFHDTFKSLIDENQSLSDIQKLHYLRACVKGEASSIISTIENTSNNYAIAWGFLKERFDNRRIIIQQHVRNIFDLPAITKESAQNIRLIIDKIQTNLRSLKNLGEEVDHWDTVMIHLVVSKLDRQTHKEWEKSLKGDKMPSFKQFVEFLTEKCQVLESMTSDNSSYLNNVNKSNNRTNNQTNHQPNSIANKKQALNTHTVSCPLCNGSHRLFMCQNFLKLVVKERVEFAKNKRLCFNCLASGHRNTDCRSKNCKKCDRKHNTLLHVDSHSSNLTSLVIPNEVNAVESLPQATCPGNSDNKMAVPTQKTQLYQVSLQSQVLLATAVVDVLGIDNTKRQARILLDAGAMSNFMTESFAKSLGLTFKSVDIAASGLNKLETRIRHSVNVKLFSKFEEFETTLEFLVVPNVCDVIPASFINKTNIDIPSYIQLADPKFNVPSEIDALIGAELYYELLNSGQIKINDHHAKLMSTRLGWIIAGKFNGIPKSKKAGCLISLQTLNDQMNRFWEIEELPETKFLSEEDLLVENHYKNTTVRNNQGHYIVKLPFNKLQDKLGDSFKIAEKRLYALEKRFRQNQELKKQYVEVMREYIRDGHMVEVEQSELRNQKTLFLPHQAVLKESSLTTKVRVVIDASAPTSTGYSLNNALYKGVNLTPDIFGILINIRVPIFAFIADVKKFYLVVLVAEGDSWFQLILWRENENEEIKIFRIIKIIFGEAPSAFLAIRTIMQLADDEKNNFPIASDIVKKRLYVDNLAAGANSMQSAILARDQLINLLAEGGFILRQWVANDPQIVESLPENLKVNNESNVTQSLGITWDNDRDEIIFDLTNKIPEDKDITKRTMLSDLMSLIYDRIGLMATLKIKFKIIMRETYCLETGWDDPLPAHILQPYKQLKIDMNKTKEIRFPRKIIIDQYVSLELHGFCDASEWAYGACIYIRSENKNGEIMSRLLCARSRVSPLKKTTLARLELCGALLLAKLYEIVSSALELNFNEIMFWSDSSIVLQWISSQPYKLKTFVANRISEIRNITSPSCWRHVPGQQNPADLVSRGQTAIELSKSNLWTQGPDWLMRPKIYWPKNKFELSPLPDEENKKPIVLAQKLCGKMSDILQKFSSFDKMVRIFAYVLRFLHNAHKDTEKLTGQLTTDEYRQSRIKVILLTQLDTFKEEIENLRKNQSVNNSSSLKALNPFIDSFGLIRVGRLKYASVLGEKNAIILPKHQITTMIIRETHLRHFHAGVNATLNAVRYQYWPINGRSQVKNILSKNVSSVVERTPRKLISLWVICQLLEFHHPFHLLVRE